MVLLPDCRGGSLGTAADRQWRRGCGCGGKVTERQWPQVVEDIQWVGKAKGSVANFASSGDGGGDNGEAWWQ